MRTTWSVICLLLTVLVLSGCPKRNTVVRADLSAVQNARALTKAGRPLDAFEAFEKILKKSPDDLAAHRGLIEAAYYAGKMAGIEDRYREMVKGDRAGIGHYGLALVASAKGEMAPALDHFAQAAEAMPDEADLPYRMAKVYMQDGQYTKAAPLLEQSLAKDGDLAGARIAYAKCLFEAGRDKAAIEAMRPVVGQKLSAADAGNARAVAASVFDPQRGLPVELSAEVNKATEFLQREASQPALTVLNGLMARFPEQALLHTLKGLAHSQMGDNGEAVVAYERALELRPDSPLTLVSLGDVYMRLEKYARARGYYEQALALDPFFLDAYRRLGEMGVKLGDFDRAVKNFEMLVLLQPDLQANRRLYAQTLVQAGRLQEAVGAYKIILSESEEDLRTIISLARLHMLLGRQDPVARKHYRNIALDYAKQAEELAPDSEAVKQLLSELED